MSRGKSPGKEKASAGELWGSWKLILGYARPWRWLLAVALVSAVLSCALTVIGPNYLSEMTDDIAEGLTGDIDLDEILSLTILIAVIYLVSAALGYVESYIMTTVSQRMSQRLRRDVSAKLNRVPLSYYDRTSYGDLMSRVTNDVDTMGQSLNQVVSTLVNAFCMMALSLFMMLYTDVPMALVALLDVAVGLGLMFAIMAGSQKSFFDQQRYVGEVNGYVEEQYANHEIVQAYGDGGRTDREFRGINDRLFGSAFRSMATSGAQMPLMGFMGNLGYVLVCIVGAMRVIDGDTTVGAIVAFMMYIRLFTNPLQEIGESASGIQSAAASAKRVFEVLGEPEMEADRDVVPVPAKVRGEVEFRDVRFSYVPGKEIIHGFSLKVSPGQKVAIVGPTGAGKTTMVNLLMRFYEVDSGDILVDGVSERSMRREDVRSMYCMVLQDTWLFRGTVRENLCYTKFGVTDEELDEACRAVGLYHFVHSLPNGYDTVIDNDSSMSVGQRQQMTIARAFVQDAPMLILDEATSSVDTRTEKVIQEAMDRLMAGRTSFVIAHRLSTIRDADVILVMKDGNVVESGSHDELIAKGGFYRDLYNSQFEPEGQRSSGARRPQCRREKPPLRAVPGVIFPQVCLSARRRRYASGTSHEIQFSAVEEADRCE